LSRADRRGSLRLIFYQANQRGLDCALIDAPRYHKTEPTLTVVALQPDPCPDVAAQAVFQREPYHGRDEGTVGVNLSHGLNQVECRAASHILLAGERVVTVLAAGDHRLWGW